METAAWARSLYEAFGKGDVRCVPGRLAAEWDGFAVTIDEGGQATGR